MPETNQAPQALSEKLAGLAAKATPTIGGLSAEDWAHVAQIANRWPRLGAATPAQAQAVVAAANVRIEALRQQENSK